MGALRNIIPSYIRALPVYKFGKPLEELAREKKLSHISKLASNENPLGPSPLAIREMGRSLNSVHRYPDPQAFLLKKKIAAHWDLKRENIILGSGSEAIMDYIVQTLIQPGDEILTFENTFIAFYILAQKARANIQRTPLKANYQYDVEALKEGITKKTKLIYIANPNNPTGTYMTRGEFEYLMEYVPLDCTLLFDEAYFEYACEHNDYPDSMNYRHDNVITTRTFSKAYGLSGLRVGYGFAHEFFIEHFNKVAPVFRPNTLAQIAARAAMSDHSHLEKTIASNKELRGETLSFLGERGFDPIESATNFVAFKVGTEKAALNMFHSLLDQRGYY